MEENKNKTPWWEPAVALFGRVSSWVVVPIVLALVGGKALDKHFETTPILFLSLTALAFIISCYGIVRIVSKYIKNINNGK
jgi:hypothetical protein